jgi:hypothetical protein
VLRDVASAHASDEAAAWLADKLDALAGEGSFQRVPFFASYAGAGRRFAGGPPKLRAAEFSALREVGIEVPEAWALADLARGALLCTALEAAPANEHVALAREVFLRGDNDERIALLRTLALLPEPDRFVDLATEACRTHVDDVFAAIACDNPFPARYLPEAAFNQIVLKTMFVNLSVGRIVGWRERNNAELRRMVSDYADERRAAGRSVPDGVAMIRA